MWPQLIKCWINCSVIVMKSSSLEFWNQYLLMALVRKPLKVPAGWEDVGGRYRCRFISFSKVRNCSDPCMSIEMVRSRKLMDLEGCVNFHESLLV